MSTLISTNFAIDEDAETIRHVDEIRTNSDEIIFIRAITMLHEKLIDIMDLMNRCYSFQVYTIALLLTLFPTNTNIHCNCLQSMICVAGSFAISVISAYSLYRTMIAPTEAIDRLAIMQMTWAMYFKCLILTLIGGCSSTTREVIHYTSITTFIPWSMSLTLLFTGKSYRHSRSQGDQWLQKSRYHKQSLFW